jgi:hypothetical protein
MKPALAATFMGGVPMKCAMARARANAGGHRSEGARKTEMTAMNEFSYADEHGMTDTAYMKTILITRTGGPDVLEIIDHPVPKLAPGEVLIKAHAIGVAYFDMLIRSGGYPWMPKLPYVPGNEMSGNVVNDNGTDL